MNYKSLLTKYKGVSTSRGVIPNDAFMYCVIAIIEMGFDLNKNTAKDLLECAAGYYYRVVLREEDGVGLSGESSSPDWITPDEEAQH